MKTRELIAALQKEDPDGDCEVVADGTPIYFVDSAPAYWDGPLDMLIHDDSKRPYYSIVGYKVTDRGRKIRLNVMTLEDVLCDDADAVVDLSELHEDRRERWQARVDAARAESKAADAMLNSRNDRG